MFTCPTGRPYPVDGTKFFLNLLELLTVARPNGFSPVDRVLFRDSYFFFPFLASFIKTTNKVLVIWISVSYFPRFIIFKHLVFSLALY